MTPTITRILVPTDFSATSDAALEFAKTIATTFGASLHLLHVFEDPYVPGAFGAETYAPLSPTMRAELLEEAAARLGHRLPPEEKERFRGTTEIVSGVGATAIVEYARDHDINLIVMGTHGRTGVAHLLIGSVAERVVRTAGCPVLTVHNEGKVVTHEARAYWPEMPEQVPA